MKRIYWGLIILTLVPWGLEAQLGLGPRAEAEVELFIEEGQARPGDTVHAGVLMTLPFGRHTYWKNPGDVPADTEISWTLPKGCTVGEISWPIPQKYFSRILYSYVYEGQVLLMIPIHLDKGLATGPHKIRATVEWTECARLKCFQGKASISANVVVGEKKTPGKEAKLFDKWRKLTPEHNKPLELPAWWVRVKGKRSVRFRVPVANKKTEVYFFPLEPARANYAVEPATVRENGEAHATLTKKVRVRKGKEPTTITGVLVKDGQGWNTTLKLGKAPR